MHLISKIRRKLRTLVYGNFNVPIGNDYMGLKAKVYETSRQDEIFWKKESEYVKKTITQLVGTENIETVLDLPSGTGRFFPMYEALNLKYIGGDLSDDMLLEGDKKIKNDELGQNFRMSSTNIPLPSNSVDIIVCLRFLQWIIPFKEVKKTLQEFHRVSRKYCIVEFCVGKHKKPTIFTNYNLTMWDNFNMSEIENLLGEHSFKVLSTVCLGDDKENPNLTTFLCEKI